MEERPFTGFVTPRLQLRRFRPSDAEAFRGYRTLPEVARFQSERWLTMTMAEAAEFVREQASAEPFLPDSWFQMAIEHRDSGLLLGDIGLHSLPDISEAELGFTLAPPYQHQGYALEAVRAVVGWLFGERSLRRVIGVADTRNLPSIRLLEKLGMRLEDCSQGEVRYALSGQEWS